MVKTKLTARSSLCVISDFVRSTNENGLAEYLGRIIQREACYCSRVMGNSADNVISSYISI